MSEKLNLTVRSIFIDGKFYRVEEYPTEEIENGNYDIFNKGIAYHVKTDLTNLILPYKGSADSHADVWDKDTEPGIYRIRMKHDKYAIAIHYPRGKAEREMYSPDHIKDLASSVLAGEYKPDQFIDVDEDMANGDSFLPPLHSNDDLMNRIVKTAIRLKDAPFEPYGKRLEACAVAKGKKGSTESINIKNNSKRGISKNSAMSSTKAVLYTNTWDLRFAIVVQDVPGASNPMFENGSSLIIYSNGAPFKIDPNKMLTVQEVLEGEGGPKPTQDPLDDLDVTDDDYTIEEDDDE